MWISRVGSRLLGRSGLESGSTSNAKEAFRPKSILPSIMDQA